jgi:hypothetical protein
VLKLNDATNGELRAEIGRLNDKLVKKDDIALKYKELKIEYR